MNVPCFRFYSKRKGGVEYFKGRIGPIGRFRAKIPCLFQVCNILFFPQKRQPLQSEFVLKYLRVWNKNALISDFNPSVLDTKILSYPLFENKYDKVP
jgi:hypothetical protein